MPTLFTKIAPAAARLRTLFHRHAAGIGFKAGGKEWRFGPGTGGRRHGATVYGTLGEAEFTVWLDSPDWKTAAAGVLGVPAASVDALPDQLVRAALECFAAEALAALEQAAGTPVAVTGLERAESDPLASACPFELLGGDGLRLAGSWVAAESGAGGAVERLLRSRAVPGRALPDDFPVAAAVCVGLWRAPLSALEGLAPGDVALSPAGAERFVVIGSKLRCAARLADGVLSVEGKTMADAKNTPAPAPGAGPAGDPISPLDEVEVDVQARVGRITMTLAQLRQLGAGQVIEFSTPVESPATLLANGRPVATGELVDVGGRVGVKITAMAE